MSTRKRPIKHNSEKRKDYAFSCPSCQRKFRVQEALDDHRRGAHKEDK